jgi:hypothetical protein
MVEVFEPTSTRSQVESSRVKCYVTTEVSRPHRLGIKHPSGAFYYCLTVAYLLIGRSLSNERAVLSFTSSADPHYHSLSWVRVPWDWRRYFTVSDSRIPISSPPTTRRVTVEVFYPASTGYLSCFWFRRSWERTQPRRFPYFISAVTVCLSTRNHGNTSSFRVTYMPRDECFHGSASIIILV